MFVKIIRVLVLGALTGLTIGLWSGQAAAQEMDSKFREALLDAFSDSTKKLDLGNGIKVPGHEIGNGKFKPCVGDTIDINGHSLTRSDPCPESSGTHNIRPYTGQVLGFDARTSLLELRDDATGKTVRVFIPDTVRLVEEGKLGSPGWKMPESGGPLRVTVYSVLPERIEAIAVH